MKTVVTGMNGLGEGPASSEAPATPLAPPTAVTLTSIAAQDGWALASGETTSVGGPIKATTSTTSARRVGDDDADRQHKSVVSFDSYSIPDGATLVSAALRLLRGPLTGTNPFTTHGTCWVDGRIFPTGQDPLDPHSTPFASFDCSYLNGYFYPRSGGLSAGRWPSRAPGRAGRAAGAAA